MRAELLNHLDARLGLNPASLRSYAEDGEHVTEGLLLAGNGTWYPIVDGVPCFLQGSLKPDLSAFCRKYGLPGGEVESRPLTEQAKTNVTFSDKWRRFRDYGLQPSHQGFLQEWYCKKLGVKTVA